MHREDFNALIGALERQKDLYRETYPMAAITISAISIALLETYVASQTHTIQELKEQNQDPQVSDLGR